MRVQKKFLTVMFIICSFISILQTPVYAGWGHHTHINYLHEAIRILPVFDYEMCKYYLSHLTEGAVEGEYHFRYIHKNIPPVWLNGIDSSELYLLNGIPINNANSDDSVNLFYRSFESLRSEIKNVQRKNSEILFDLAYLLQSVNNIVVPEYTGKYMGEHGYVHQTSSIDIRTEKIEEISDFKGWLRNRFAQLLKYREEWNKAGEDQDKEKFQSIAMDTNEYIIYTNAALIHYVLDDCFGPEHPEVRKSVGKHHEQRLNSNGGRKPGIGSEYH